MVLNDHKPYDVEDSEDEAWEMVSAQEDAALLAAEAELELAEEEGPNDVANAGAETGEDAAAGGDADGLHAEDDASAVSSITRDHHSVSDVEDEEGEPVGQEPTATAGADGDLFGRRFSFGNQLRGGPIPSLTEADPQAAGLAEVGGSVTLTGKGHVAHELDLEEEEAEGSGDGPDEDGGNDEKSAEEVDPLVETLAEMGFSKERIEKAIAALRGSGEAEIDADSVIGEMEGEWTAPASEDNDHPTHPFQAPLAGTWDFVESNVRALDEHHQLRRRTQACAHNLGRSARELWSDVRDESQKFRSNLHASCNDADARVRDATTELGCRASSAKDSLRRANEEHRILEKVAAVAAVGGATLLALGNPRAGVGAMAVAGASLAAGEAIKQGPARSGRYTGDYGLDEGVHLD